MYLAGIMTLYDSFKATGDLDTGKRLLESLDKNRKETWETKMESLNFAKSSRKAEQKRNVNRSYLRNFRLCQVNSTFSAPVTIDEVNEALDQVENGKAPGIDNIYPNFLKNLGPAARKWIARFYSNIYDSGRIPKAWKMARVTAILKPNKEPHLPKNYRPISLLSCCYKLFERVMLARIRDVIDIEIAKEQAGFRKNRNCCDQVLALTSLIELGFQNGHKTAVVFVDLSAAYDTVWKRGLLFKLSQIIPCLKTLALVMDMLSDRSFQVEMNRKTSRKRVLNNGLPQISVLASFLYCVYTNDALEKIHICRRQCISKPIEDVRRSRN